MSFDYKKYAEEHKQETQERSRLWYIKNKKHHNQQGKENYKKNRTQVLERQTEYWNNHKEEKSKYDRIWHLLNRDKKAKQQKEYMKTPEGKLARKVGNHNRRTRQLGFSKLTLEKVQQVYENNIKKYGTLTCVLCDKPIKFGEDILEHLTPIARTKDFLGVDLNDISNLGVAHGVKSTTNCNSCKGKKTLKEWQKYYKLQGLK